MNCSASTNGLGCFYYFIFGRYPPRHYERFKMVQYVYPEKEVNLRKRREKREKERKSRGKRDRPPTPLLRYTPASRSAPFNPSSRIPLMPLEHLEAYLCCPGISSILMSDLDSHTARQTPRDMATFRESLRSLHRLAAIHKL
jgi:hypothetical protein